MRMTLPTIRWQSPQTAEKSLDSHEHVIVLAGVDDKNLRRLPHGETILARMRRASRNLKDREAFVLDLPNARGTRITLAGIEPGATSFECLAQARTLADLQYEHRAKRIAIVTVGLKADDTERALEAMLAALLAGALPLPSYKRKPDDKLRLQEILLPAVRKPAWLERCLAEARGNHLARTLTVLPPNELTPASYRRRVEKLAREHGWRTRFYDLKKLRTLGAGAFVAVAQGSPDADAGILHLQYRPKKKPAGKLALVGKGICFDTGGTNLKSARHMLGMHEDMEGSAVALGILQALTELKADFAVDCWLALAQNHIGPKSYRPTEVITALNGTTIEIVHTDAEGRMVLADTLTLAAREKPKLLIDYATLTGSCINALSTRMSGVFTNRSEWIPTLIESGEDSGERVWPFPIPADFEKSLKSKIADTKQCTIDSEADHILAALFLKKFLVGDPAWLHIDLASGNHRGGLAHIPTDVTGFGVRLTLDLLLGKKLLHSALP